jgi:hypothetical protein
VIWFIKAKSAIQLVRYGQYFWTRGLSGVHLRAEIKQVIQGQIRSREQEGRRLGQMNLCRW